MALIRPKEEYRLFLFLHMFSDAWRRVIAGRVLIGATVDRIPLTSFPNFPILLPERKIAAVFGETVEPPFKLIETLVEQNEKLIQARDLLLPRLMNGEIAVWLHETIVEIIISEAQNEVADFKKWDFDIIPHRALMKKGFEIEGGERVDVETAFKNPSHPFRVAIVCAMWLTGFDVECLSTLYIDKPLKAHTLMQAIARANRV
jgi:hypothetical protein